MLVQGLQAPNSLIMTGLQAGAEQLRSVVASPESWCYVSYLIPPYTYCGTRSTERSNPLLVLQSYPDFAGEDGQRFTSPKESQSSWQRQCRFFEMRSSITDLSSTLDKLFNAGPRLSGWHLTASQRTEKHPRDYACPSGRRELSIKMTAQRR
jgi:hypothetical protein